MQWAWAGQAIGQDNSCSNVQWFGRDRGSPLFPKSDFLRWHLLVLLRAGLGSAPLRGERGAKPQDVGEEDMELRAEVT